MELKENPAQYTIILSMNTDESKKKELCALLEEKSSAQGFGDAASESFIAREEYYVAQDILSGSDIEQSAANLHMALQTEIEAQRLTINNNHILLAFYEDLITLTPERSTGIAVLCEKFSDRVHCDLRVIIYALRDQMASNDGMRLQLDNLDAALMAAKQISPCAQIFLVDHKPLNSPTPYYKATIRYMREISRLRAPREFDDAPTAVLYNLTLVEYDQIEASKITKAISEIDDQLAVNSEVKKAQYCESFLAHYETVCRGFRMHADKCFEAIDSANMPIPSEGVYRGLCQKKGARQALIAMPAALQATYRYNVYNKIIDRIEETIKSSEFIDSLMRGIPISYINETVALLDMEIERLDKSTPVRFSCTIEPGSRKKINGQIDQLWQEWHKKTVAYLFRIFHDRMRETVCAYAKASERNEERSALLQERHRLLVHQKEISRWNSVSSFFENAQSLLDEKIALPHGYTASVTVLLIGRAIAQDWERTYQNDLQNVNAPAYYASDLKGISAQLIKRVFLNEENYAENKHRLFHVAEGTYDG